MPPLFDASHAVVYDRAIRTELTQDTWAREFTRLAEAHWTPERTRDLAAGKQLEILPGEAPLLLRALGLLHRDASMQPREARKFLQINHVVRVMRSAIAELSAQHRVVRLLDAGCGRSYLTMLLAWCAKHRWGQRIEVLGIDRNPALIEECERRVQVAQLDDVVKFVTAPLDTVALEGPFHGVFALHACDTATCDAIALGIRLDAQLIAVAPCCQAELARGWSRLAGKPGAFAPIWSMPHLRRETAAHLTDAMRVLLLRAVGYDVTPMEFIAAEHTKKNTLIRALRRGIPDDSARAEYAALVAATGGVGIALASVLDRRTLMNKPSWWRQEHDGAWDRVKDAMKRDWEQTKSDLTGGRKGTDLGQGVGDTVKQAAGKDLIPPVSIKNPPEVDDKDWKGVEDEHRYGVGARDQYKDDNDWNDKLEGKLKEEWNDLKSGRTWDEVKGGVRRGWDRARK